MIFKCPIFLFADVFASSLPSILEFPGTTFRLRELLGALQSLGGRQSGGAGYGAAVSGAEKGTGLAAHARVQVRFHLFPALFDHSIKGGNISESTTKTMQSYNNPWPSWCDCPSRDDMGMRQKTSGLLGEEEHEAKAAGAGQGVLF